MHQDLGVVNRETLPIDDGRRRGRRQLHSHRPEDGTDTLRPIEVRLTHSQAVLLAIFKTARGADQTSSFLC